MRTTLFVVFALVAISQALTDKEIIQQGLNGLFDQNKLSRPTTIVDCFDDQTAHKLVEFGGQILAKAAAGSVSDLLNIITLSKQFISQLPTPVTDCLSTNQQLAALGLKYGIDSTTDPATIQKKIATYAVLHYSEVHKQSVLINDLFVAGKYYDFGYQVGAYGHKVFKMSKTETPNLSDKEVLQQALNGLFEQNKLPDPTTIVPCIDDATAHKIVVFMGEVLQKAAKGSVSDLISLVNMIKGFGDQIPQSVKDCLAGNKEFETLGYKYGVTPTTDSSAIEKKVIAYVTLHYLEVHKWLGDLNNNWKAGKFYQVGFDAAGYGHKVLGMTLSSIAKLRSE